MKLKLRRHAGFTLIEMVIALVLASLLSVVVVSGLHLGIRSWESVSETVYETNDNFISMHAIRRILSSIQAESIRDENGIQVIAFYGGTDTVLFVAPFEQLGNAGTLYWVMIKEREYENGDQAVVLHLMPFTDTSYLEEEDLNPLLNRVIWEEKIDEIMAHDSETLGSESNFSSVVFEYLTLDNNGDPLWEEEWDDNTQLPRAIKIDMTFGDEEDWPTMYVVPNNNTYEFKTLL